MTRREVVKAAINHEETDQVPYFINFTRDALPIIQEVYKGEDLSIDIGNYVHWVRPPWWRWHEVPDDFRGYHVPDGLPKTRGTGSYEAFEEEIARLKEETGCYILVMIYGSHFEKANAARGIEYFLADLGGNREFAKKMLGKIIDKNMTMLENMVTIDGIDGILLGSDWGSQQALLMSPDCWHELIAPGEKKEYDLIKGEEIDVWIHSCGNIEAIIGDLIDMGVDVLNPVQPECMNIEHLKKTYGKGITFWGGISTQQTLPYGTPEEVTEEVSDVVKLMSAGGGYITSPAQEIQNDVPLQNMLALIEAAKKYG